ncbi:hypothetical protein CI610_00821 [invertebrate metagenome]|uniref:Uncharacterized protein n=1 Tax=invertebrate metagenome TaxID=1711999 RepID=A0A2H9TAR3_9ZZZZ
MSVLTLDEKSQRDRIRFGNCMLGDLYNAFLYGRDPFENSYCRNIDIYLLPPQTVKKHFMGMYEDQMGFYKRAYLGYKNEDGAEIKGFNDKEKRRF